jgi:prolyl oligopeptidase
VRDAATGDDLPDLIEWSKFSGAAWLKDGSGFYYSRYNKLEEGQAYQGVNYNQKLYFHRLNTPQADDALVYERPDHKEWGFGAEVSRDGRYLILQVWEGIDVRNRIFYQDLQAEAGVVELLSELEAAYHFVGNDGPAFYFRTNLDAPRGRLIAIDTTRPGKTNWQALIPQTEDVLESVVMVHDEFVALYMRHVHHQIKRFDLRGSYTGEIALPAFSISRLIWLELGGVLAMANPG